MKRSTKFGLIVLLLVVVECISLFFMYKSLNNKKSPLSDVVLQEMVKSNNSMFAIMLEQQDGTYLASESNSWPANGYVLNTAKSGCIDNDGNKMENAFSYNDGIASVTTGKTSYCYLYFDKTPTFTLTTDTGNSGLSVGDEVILSSKNYSDQYFYVINTNASSTTLFAKYNLYVGNIYSDQGNTLVKKLTSEDEGYGLQNSTAKGAYTGVTTIGTVPFSKINYWPNSGSITPNIYDSTLSETEDWSDNNYSIAYYVEQYIRLLNITATGRLLIDSERSSLNYSYNSIIYNQSSYYIGTSACRYGSCPYVVSITNNSDVPYDSYNTNNSKGVRPVIIISTDDIIVNWQIALIMLI